MLSGKATLLELSRDYDLDDLADFHDALDIEIELAEAERPQRGPRR